MAAKPSTTPRWADVGGAITVPSSGKQNVGWAAGERPPAQFLNWLFNLIYQWILYLRDGAFVGDHSITGALSVSTDLAVTDDVTVGGDVDITGTAEVTGTLTVSDNVTLTQNMSLGGHVIFPNDQITHVPIFAGEVTQGNTYTPPTSALTQGVRLQAFESYAVGCPSTVPIGARIKNVVFYGTRASGTITFAIEQKNLVTGGDTSIATVTDNSTTTFQGTSLNAPGSGTTITSSGPLHFLIVCDGSGEIFLQHLAITWDRPT